MPEGRFHRTISDEKAIRMGLADFEEDAADDALIKKEELDTKIALKNIEIKAMNLEEIKKIILDGSMDFQQRPFSDLQTDIALRLINEETGLANIYFLAEYFNFFSYADHNVILKKFLEKGLRFPHIIEFFDKIPPYSIFLNQNSFADLFTSGNIFFIKKDKFKQIYKLPVEIALGMIKKGSAKFVLENPAYFVDIDLNKDVALRMLENHENVDTFFNVLNRFSGLDKQIMLHVLSSSIKPESRMYQNYCESLRKNISVFSGLDKEVALRILETQDKLKYSYATRILINNLGHFSGLDKEIALLLSKKYLRDNELEILFLNANVFSDFTFTDDEVFDLLPSQKNGALEDSFQYIKKYREFFPDIVFDKDFAMACFQHGCYRWVLRNLPEYSNLDKEVALALLHVLGSLGVSPHHSDLDKTSQTRLFLDHAGCFTGLDKEVCLVLMGIVGDEMMSKWFAERTTAKLCFTGFDAEIAERLLQAGPKNSFAGSKPNKHVFGDFLIAHIDEFSGLTARTALLSLKVYGTEFLPKLWSVQDHFSGLNNQLETTLLDGSESKESTGNGEYAPDTEKVSSDVEKTSNIKRDKNFLVQLFNVKPREVCNILLNGGADFISGLDKETALFLLGAGDAPEVALVGGAKLSGPVILDESTMTQPRENELQGYLHRKLSEFILHNKDVFAGFTVDDELVKILFSHNVWQNILYENLDCFSGLSEESAFKMLTECANFYDYFNAIINNQSSFADLKLSRDFLSKVLYSVSERESGYSKRVVAASIYNNRDLFKDIHFDSSTVVWLVGLASAQEGSSGDSSTVLENIFKDIDGRSDIVLSLKDVSDFGPSAIKKIATRLHLVPELEELYLKLPLPAKDVLSVFLECGVVPSLNDGQLEYFADQLAQAGETARVKDEEGDSSHPYWVNEKLWRASEITRLNLQCNIEVTPEELLALSKVYVNYEIYKKLILNYTVRELIEYAWAVNSHEVADLPSEDKFPCEGDPQRIRGKQEAWLVNHAQFVPTGWQTKRLGAMIFNRLYAGIDTTIHDATYWLKEFEVPEQVYGFAPEELPSDYIGPPQLERRMLPCKDVASEIDFLCAVMNTPEKMRGKLPSNPNKYRELFSSPAVELIYQILLPLAKIDSVDFATLESKVKAELNTFETIPDKQHALKVPLGSISDDVTTCLATLKTRMSVDNVSSDIPPLIEKLKEMSQRRTAYIDDAQTWVNTHQSTPRSILTYAWGNRPDALFDGCADNPRAIKQWAHINALRIAMETMAQGEGFPENFSTTDLVAYAPWLAELVRCYSGETAINTVARLKKEFNPEFEIPPAKIDLGGGWFGEIIPKNDPRGFSIGFDTGCCMTLGGASQSCIQAGYTKAPYGFFALYRDGRLCAQSFLYTNKKQSPRTIVCDNIEANQGRDREEILKRYQQFFDVYLTGGLSQESDFFTEVNVGTGYTEVGLGSLKTTTSVPMPLDAGETIYTDAEIQKRLFEVPDEKLSALMKAGENITTSKKDIKSFTLLETIAVKHLPPKTRVDFLTDKQALIVAELESTVYSQTELRVKEFFDKELKNKNSHNLLISEQEEANEIPVGYVLAHETISALDSNERVLLVYDIAIVPSARRKGLARAALLKILAVADQCNLPIEIQLNSNRSDLYKILKEKEAAVTGAGYHIAQDKELDGTRVIRLHKNQIKKIDDEGEEEGWNGDENDDDETNGEEVIH